MNNLGVGQSQELGQAFGLVSKINPDAAVALIGLVRLLGHGDSTEALEMLEFAHQALPQESAIDYHNAQRVNCNDQSKVQ